MPAGVEEIGINGIRELKIGVGDDLRSIDEGVFHIAVFDGILPFDDNILRHIGRLFLSLPEDVPVIPEKSQESGEHHQKRGEKNQKRGNPCFQLGILVHAVTDTFRIVCGMKQIRSSAMSPREPTGIASSAA